MNTLDTAQIIYVTVMFWLCICLGFGHRKGKINLWELVTATDKQGNHRTDSRKLFETGAFLVMTIGFAFLVVVGKLTEFYALIYVGTFVAARSMRDREQRLNRIIDNTKTTQEQQS